MTYWWIHCISIYIRTECCKYIDDIWNWPETGFRNFCDPLSIYIVFIYFAYTYTEWNVYIREMTPRCLYISEQNIFWSKVPAAAHAWAKITTFNVWPIGTYSRNLLVFARSICTWVESLQLFHNYGSSSVGHPTGIANTFTQGFRFRLLQIKF